MSFRAHNNLADYSAAESYGDHLAQEASLGVVDLLSPELAWPDVGYQHATHARSQSINEPSTFASI